MTAYPSQSRTSLFDEYGAYIPLAVAWRWLSYPSIDAARKAFARGVTPVPMQRLEHRRGIFIPTARLIDWLNANTKDGLHPQATPTNGVPP